MSHHTTDIRSNETIPAAETSFVPIIRTSRLWAWSGVAAGILSIAASQASRMASVNWELTQGDAEAMLMDASGKQSTYLAFHVLAVLALLSLTVFGAGLKRRLDERTPSASLYGQVAFAGLLLTAGALLLGSGLDTQFVLGLSAQSAYVPESAAFYTDWVATIPWVWAASGLAAIAVAVPSLKYRAVPRWIGIVSLVFGILILLTEASPL